VKILNTDLTKSTVHCDESCSLCPIILELTNVYILYQNLISRVQLRERIDMGKNLKIHIYPN
jgi:hypothetical protein